MIGGDLTSNDNFHKLKSVIISEFLTEVEKARIKTSNNKYIMDVSICATVKCGGICGLTVKNKKINSDMKNVLDQSE